MTKKVIGEGTTPQNKLDQKSAVEAIKAAAAARQLQQQSPQQVQGQPFDFTKCHLHIGIPCYGGMVSEPTMTSFLRFTLMAAKIGLNWSLDTMVNESLVTRARNNLCAKMMTNDQATHFMFIDADIRFEPEAIFGMIAADKDVISKMAPAIGNVMSNPSTATQLNTLIKNAGGGV